MWARQHFINSHLWNIPVNWGVCYYGGMYRFGGLPHVCPLATHHLTTTSFPIALHHGCQCMYKHVCTWAHMWGGANSQIKPFLSWDSLVTSEWRRDAQLFFNVRNWFSNMHSVYVPYDQREGLWSNSRWEKNNMGAYFKWCSIILKLWACHRRLLSI